MNDYVGIGILVVLLWLSHRLSKIHAQGQAIAFRLDKLLERQGVAIGETVEPSDEVRRLARIEGGELEAITAYRRQSGLGFKEAKAVVQSLAQASPGDG